MNLDDLRSKLASLPQNAPERAGLSAFITQAEKLPPGVTIMGKIQRSFVDLATVDKVNSARSFDEVKSAFGPAFRVQIEA